MGWMEAIGSFARAAGTMAQVHQLNEWLDKDLSAAIAEVEYLVTNYPPEVIDSYEVLMLRVSRYMFDPDQRVRLMKLYACLKLVETSRFGFRGFAEVDA